MRNRYVHILNISTCPLLLSFICLPACLATCLIGYLLCWLPACLHGYQQECLIIHTAPLSGSLPGINLFAYFHDCLYNCMLYCLSDFAYLFGFGSGLEMVWIWTFWHTFISLRNLQVGKHVLDYILPRRSYKSYKAALLLRTVIFFLFYCISFEFGSGSALNNSEFPNTGPDCCTNLTD